MCSSDLGERGRRGRGETETKGEIDKEIGDQRGGSKEGMQEKAGKEDRVVGEVLTQKVILE